jgi:hypothetical protein
MEEKLKPVDSIVAAMHASSSTGDDVVIHGHFSLKCTGSDGKPLWEDEFDNTVVTVGKGELLSSALNSSAYTSSNFISLIAGAVAPTIAAADTMASHAGWLEASGANAGYTGTRPALTFANVTTGTIVSSTASFVIANSGTITGGFIDYGPGATSTVGGTVGVLLSAGAITTPQPVISGNTITMTYTLSM